MLSETTTIMLMTEDQQALARALSGISLYLESSSHCQSYLLTRHLMATDGYILCCTWDAPRWRMLAWRYFTDVLTASGVEFHVSSQIQQEEREPC